MNLVKCANGHYYDADKFYQCPHCKELLNHDVTQTVPLEAPAPQEESHTMDLDAKQQVLRDELQEELSKSMVNAQIAVEEEPDLTVGYYANLIGREPVVGFLICTKGGYYGESFNLKSGRNFIGRASNMDIVLDMDPTVSRERHAVIFYEPHERVFYAQPGDSHGILYLNDKVVLDHVILKAYDVISVGNTKLMFIPCCGPDFCWEDVKND